ncbi:MAG TPA: SprB repeat-containing protein, partial [Bacteroidia bacterium]|nr:SprB repeat-containing protein [Bacteroidia bacterium]
MRKLLVLPFFIFQFLIVSAQKPCSLITTVSTIANVSCNGGDNGSATANPSNGTAPYTYSWSDASSQSNDTAIGLSAGNYTVTVQDAGNCTASASVVVTEPNPINVLVSVPHISCIGRSVCGYTIAS